MKHLIALNKHPDNKPMKKLKQIVAQVKTLSANSSNELNDKLWELICYSPKMPLRLQQEQLLNEAAKFSFKVNDEFFAKKELLFHGFKWGNGKHKVLLTHGWGSKAADFAEIITALKEISGLEIIAFDAPGNGSSEGELSNLLLFAKAVEAVVLAYGKPDIIIGHSLGAMANVIACREMKVKPALLVSLAPLILLKENFEASMRAVGVSSINQDRFLKSFEDRFETTASSFNLTEIYTFDFATNHWLAYDQNDPIAPFSYLKILLDKNPWIKSQHYDQVGHDKILRSPQVIQDLIEKVRTTLTP